MDFDSASLFIPQAARTALQQTLQDLPVARHELRNNDHSGRFVELGIATIDNGISAMLPPNSRRVRRALYHTEYGGYYPLNEEKVDGAGAVMSNNLQILPPQIVDPPDWSHFQRSGSSVVKFLGWDRAIERMRDNPLIINGEILLPLTSADQQVWIQVQGDRQSFWLKASKSIGPAQSEDGLLRLEWRADIATHWLSETRFDFIVRLEDQRSASYLDSETYSVVVHRPYPFAQPSRSKPANERLARSLFPNQQASQWQVNFDSRALPRAYIASSCQLFADEVQASAFLANTPQLLVGKIALFAREQGYPSVLPDDFCESYSSPFKRVGIINDQGNWLQMNQVKGPGLLYLNDTFYPGWSAYDRNTEQALAIQPANLGMRVVYLPDQRDYDIVFRYQPDWLYLAYLLLVMALLVTIYLLLVIAKKNKAQS